MDNSLIVITIRHVLSMASLVLGRGNALRLLLNLAQYERLPDTDMSTGLRVALKLFSITSLQQMAIY